MSPRQPIPVDMDALLEAYRSDVSIAELCKRFGISNSLLYRKLKATNEPRRKVRIDVARAVELYDTPLPLRQVALRMGLRVSALDRALRLSGWTSRGSRKRGQVLPLAKRDEIKRRTYRGESVAAVARDLGIQLRTAKKYQAAPKPVPKLRPPTPF